jgi:hypothetical protein
MTAQSPAIVFRNPVHSRLVQDHRDLLAIADEFERRVRAPRLVDLDGLIRCKWRLSRVLTQHLALEDAQIYDRLAKDKRPKVVTLVTRLKKELGYLVDDYFAHCERWTSKQIVNDWPGYCRSALRLLDALIRRIELEDRLLYPIVLDAGSSA